MTVAALASFLRPLLIIPLLLVVWFIAKLLHRFIPPGRVRDFLYRRR